MALLLRESDFDGLFSDRTAILQGLEAIALGVLAHQAGQAPLLPWVRVPLGVGHLRLVPGLVPDLGTVVRTYPVESGEVGGDQKVTWLWDQSGRLLAIMSDRRLGLWRTALPAGLAVQRLAPRPVRRVAMIGSGRQALAQLACFHAIFREQLESVTVYSPTLAHRVAFAERMARELEISVTVAGSLAEAVDRADVIGMATNRRTPIEIADEVRPGVVVVSISDGQTDPRLIVKSQVWVSARAIFEATSCTRQPYADLIPRGQWHPSQIAGDLAELLKGPVNRREDVPIVFEMPGMSVWDVAMAHFGYAWAVDHGVGHQFAFNAEGNG